MLTTKLIVIMTYVTLTLTLPIRDSNKKRFVNRWNKSKFDYEDNYGGIEEYTDYFGIDYEGLPDLSNDYNEDLVNWIMSVVFLAKETVDEIIGNGSNEHSVGESTEDDFMKQWEKFKTDFNKHYSSKAEEKKRMNIFRKNLKIINDHNEKYRKGLVNWQMAVNEHADKTIDEMVHKKTK